MQIPTDRHPRKTSRDDSRRWNLLTTLQTIAAHRTISRAEIARVTGLTRASVSSLVGELITDGLVVDLGPVEAASAGKPPALLTINDTGREIVTLDLSRQPFVGAVMGLGGGIRHRSTASSSVTGTGALSAVTELIEACLAETSSPVLGIGVGAPGMIDPDGAVRESARLDWHSLPLQATLAERFQLPVAVGNDAHISALAELRNSRHDTLLLVTVGEGIGAGLVLHGLLHTGEHLASGEIGHVVVEPDGTRCRCGLHGCLETVAAVPAVRSGDTLQAESVLAAGRRLGATLAVIVSTIDVDQVVIASELTEVPGYTEAVEGELKSRLHPVRAPRATVTSSRTPHLVLAGAAALAMRDVLGVVLR